MSKVPTIKTSVKRLSRITIEDLRTLSTGGLKYIGKILPHVLSTVTAEIKQRSIITVPNRLSAAEASQDV